MNLQVKDMIISEIDSFANVEESKGVIILYKGKHLILPSGKRIWTSRRHAACALSNALYNVRYKAYLTGLERYDTGQYIKELESEGIIEFKELK